MLSQRMASSQLYVVSRDDRTYAFDHSGIPLTVVPSRATIYHIAEQMDADYVVMGSYTFDGKSLHRPRAVAGHEEAAPVSAGEQQRPADQPD